MTPNSTMTAAIAIIALAILCLVMGCGTAGYVSCGHEFGNDPDTSGQNPICIVEVKKPVTDRLSVKLLHQSWLSSGKPFNSNKESTADALCVEYQVW